MNLKNSNRKPKVKWFVLWYAIIKLTISNLQVIQQMHILASITQNPDNLHTLALVHTTLQYLDNLRTLALVHITLQYPDNLRTLALVHITLQYPVSLLTLHLQCQDNPNYLNLLS